MKEKVNLLIIGSGPAGYTAAIYASRANIKPVLYTGSQMGGQLTLTTEVENFPGFPHGIQGNDLMTNFEEQAKRMGADIRYGTISKVDFNTYPFIIEVDDDTIIEANSVIISTGASAKWLGLESETRLNGYGVSACAVCDGFFFKNKEVAIVGGGDTAAEEAIYLSKICTNVHMIIRRNEMTASKVMQERVFNTSNIHIHFNSATDEILGEKKVEGVRLLNLVDNKTQVLDIEGFFVAIGHTPNSSLFKDFIDTDEIGYIKTIPGTSKTNIQGIFAAGDIQDKHYRQAITAAGSGCMAALDAERFLSENNLI